MLSRRSFLAAVASALVAARAPRIAAGNAMRRLDGSVAIPVPEEDTLGRLIASFLNVGDIITFGRDPREYRVLALDAHAVHFEPVDWWLAASADECVEVLTPRGCRLA
jgi:hypothetical protein